MSVGESTTDLGRVKGLGAAGHGGEHWLRERLTSIALLLLSSWLIASLLLLPDLGRPTLVMWLQGASGAIPMALFVITAFVHAIDGMKVVVDDYIDGEADRFAVNTSLLFLGIAGAAIALFAVARIAFGAEQ